MVQAAGAGGFEGVARGGVEVLRLGGDEGVEVGADFVPVHAVEVNADLLVERTHGEPEVGAVEFARNGGQGVLGEHAVECAHGGVDVVEQRAVPVPDDGCVHV